MLYLLGQTAPGGRGPTRYAFPPNRAHAEQWITQDREYATWAGASTVAQRAKRFFRDGRPFTPILQANQNRLDEAKTIRNALAHESSSAKKKFETLVRNKLTTLPVGTTVGGFLVTTMPGTTPPTSVLEYYLGVIGLAASMIVRM